MIPRATEPFHFFTLLSLTVMTGIKARDLRELLEHLQTVPESVMHHHTHSRAAGSNLLTANVDFAETESDVGVPYAATTSTF